MGLQWCISLSLEKKKNKKSQMTRTEDIKARGIWCVQGGQQSSSALAEI